jgi:hypothetical protein
MSDVFGRIIGHGAAVAVLRRAVSRPAPAYFLVGPEGLGKQAIAEAFVRSLLGVGPEAVLSAQPDLIVLAPREGKRQVAAEDVREARERLSWKPSVAPRSVAFIPDAAAFGDAAANALLKTMEEPPAGAVFVLVASSPDVVPATVRSRCVVLAFGPVPKAELVTGLMARGLSAAEAERAASGARGRPGWALSPPEMDASAVNAWGAMFVRPKLGERLQAIEGAAMRDRAEDPGASWRSFCAAGAARWRAEMAAAPPEAARSMAWVGFGIAEAWRSVGSSVPSRWALEAACAVAEAEAERRPVPPMATPLPRAVPMVYTV